MSAGCAIVASDTAPVREVIRNGEHGVLVDFFDQGALAREVAQLLSDREYRALLGERARSRAIAGYDLHSVCLPQQTTWATRLAGGG
jgi:glycosyltransferase involved in cell wall biosynthesis